MDKRQITNYVNLAALVSYILGRILHSNFLIAFGLTIMAGLSIWRNGRGDSGVYWNRQLTDLGFDLWRMDLRNRYPANADRVPLQSLSLERICT